MVHLDRTPGSARLGGRDRLVDLGLCVLVVILALPIQRSDNTSVVEAVVLATFSVGLIAARRRWPLTALSLGLAALLAATAWLDRPSVLFPVSVILLYNVAACTDRRGAVFTAIAGLVAFLVCALMLTPDGSPGPELLAAVAWPTLATATGDAVRSRAQVVAAAIERAERAERTRDEEARRRVAEERLHIARELHDLVAHNIAIVNVQAGVADHLLAADPEAAGTALRHVRAASQTVLDEISGILSVLRDDDVGAPSSPTPTVDAIPELIDSFVAAGLEVTYETAGHRQPLSGPATLATYRMVQEGLANAHKHGDGPVRLRVAYEPEGLRVNIENPVGVAAAGMPGWGYGLVGMSERVTAAGGELNVDSRQGLFLLNACLPYSQSSTDGLTR